MTPGQVTAIQESFKKVAPISEQAAALFCPRLFEIASAVKPRFRSDMKEEQGRKLMATLAVVVNGPGDLRSTPSAAGALARRHINYGVQAADYAPVGAALLLRPERGLGVQWAPEFAVAWGEAYSVLSEFMIGEAVRPQRRGRMSRA